MGMLNRIRVVGCMVACAALSSPLAAAAPETKAAALPTVDAALIAPAVAVADAARCQHFYEEVLGMRTLMVREQGAIRETMLAFAGAPQKPAIILVSNVSPAAPSLSGTGAARLIIRVRDLDAVTARMAAAGLPLPPMNAPRASVRVVHIKDPEMNDLELVQSPEVAAQP